MDLLAFPLVGKHAIVRTTHEIIDMNLEGWGREMRMRGKPALSAVYQRLLARAVAYEMELVDVTAAKRDAWQCFCDNVCELYTMRFVLTGQGIPIAKGGCSAQIEH